jgi:hypothetical protein
MEDLANMTQAVNKSCTDGSGQTIACNETCVTEVSEERDVLSLQIFMTVIYSVIFVTGFLGNVCTCLVISRNRHMQTATNYYLFSLAISDLLFLVLGFPDEMNKTWSKRSYLFGPAFCWLRGLGAETCANASILIIVAFTVERWIALCHPFSRAHHGSSRLGRVAKTICGIWILGLVFAIPQAAWVSIVQELTCDGLPIPDETICSIDPDYNEYARYAFQASTFVLFVLPMVIISFLYIRICISLARSESFFEGSSRSGGDRKQRLSYRSSASTYRRRGTEAEAALTTLAPTANIDSEAGRSSSTSQVHRAGPENSKTNVIKLLGKFCLDPTIIMCNNPRAATVDNGRKEGSQYSLPSRFVTIIDPNSLFTSAVHF